MKAVYVQKHGPIADLKISDVPVPGIGAGDVLVKVAASGVNPSDIASVEGRFPHGVLPRVAGRDFSGFVVKGPAELVGVEVWGSGGDLGITRDGTHGLAARCVPNHGIPLNGQPPGMAIWLKKTYTVCWFRGPQSVRMRLKSLR